MKYEKKRKQVDELVTLRNIQRQVSMQEVFDQCNRPDGIDEKLNYEIDLHGQTEKEALS